MIHNAPTPHEFQCPTHLPSPDLLYIVSLPTNIQLIVLVLVHTILVANNTQLRSIMSLIIITEEGTETSSLLGHLQYLHYQSMFFTVIVCVLVCVLPHSCVGTGSHGRHSHIDICYIEITPLPVRES